MSTVRFEVEQMSEVPASQRPPSPLLDLTQARESINHSVCVCSWEAWLVLGFPIMLLDRPVEIGRLLAGSYLSQLIVSCNELSCKWIKYHSPQHSLSPSLSLSIPPSLSLSIPPSVLSSAGPRPLTSLARESKDKKMLPERQWKKRESWTSWKQPRPLTDRTTIQPDILTCTWHIWQDVKWCLMLTVVHCILHPQQHNIYIV